MIHGYQESNRAAILTNSTRILPESRITQNRKACFMDNSDKHQELIKDAALLQLQKSNALEQQLKAIRANSEAMEIGILEMQKELNRMRRNIRIFWMAELLGPMLAISLILGGAWFALKYVEQHYLDGESLIDKVLMKDSPAGEKAPPPSTRP
jgi:hypothetical protein